MSNPYRQFSPASIATVIEKVAAGAKETEIFGRDGLPSRATFYRNLDEHPELAAKWAETLTERKKSNPTIAQE